MAYQKNIPEPARPEAAGSPAANKYSPKTDLLALTLFGCGSPREQQYTIELIKIHQEAGHKK
jgi:hypothetical protein